MKFEAGLACCRPSSGKDVLMCFRPASADTVPVCPNCGEKVPIMGGVVLKKCPHCKGDMPEMTAAGAPSVPVAGAPSAPKVPGVPKAPGAPK